MEDQTRLPAPVAPIDGADHHEAATDLSGPPSPLKAARRHCLWCCNGSANEVSLCPSTRCAHHPFRFGRNPDEKMTDDAGKTITALRAIKDRCIDCSGGSKHEVAACKFTACDNFAFRFGKNPNRQGRQLTDEQKAALVARLAGHRAKSDLSSQNPGSNAD
jgi:hypothetical protein